MGERKWLTRLGHEWVKPAYKIEGFICQKMEFCHVLVRIIFVRFLVTLNQRKEAQMIINATSNKDKYNDALQQRMSESCHRNGCYVPGIT